MKHLLIAVVLLTSQFAMADYLGCTLTNGFIVTEKADEGRTREVNIERRPFKCVGKLDGGRNVTVILSSTENDAFETASGAGGASVELTSLDIHGDGLDTGVCSCYIY